MPCKNEKIIYNRSEVAINFMYNSFNLPTSCLKRDSRKLCGCFVGRGGCGG